MSITIDDIEIKLKIGNSKGLLARATVIICECIEIHGWRICESKHIHKKFQEYIWIQPPSYRATTGWKPMAYINNRKLYDAIEEKMYNSYHQKRQSQQVNDADTGTKDIDLNEIPI